jgi:hypothetical protein
MCELSRIKFSLAPRSLVLENAARSQSRLPRGKGLRPEENQSES